MKTSIQKRYVIKNLKNNKYFQDLNEFDNSGMYVYWNRYLEVCNKFVNKMDARKCIKEILSQSTDCDKNQLKVVKIEIEHREIGE